MSENIPITYVPTRHTIFLYNFPKCLPRLGRKSQRRSHFIGLNALNYSGYWDCRPDYIQAMKEVFQLGTKQGREGEAIFISTPLIELKKTEIIKVDNNWGGRWEKTWSCYPNGEVACGVCDSCHLPPAAFKELGLQDPLPYPPNPNTER